MKNLLLTAAIISLFVSNAIAQPPRRPRPPREEERKESPGRLGVRIGFVATTSDLENNFGNGVDLALRWVHHLKDQFSLDIVLGTYLMGETGGDKIIAFPPLLDEVNARVLTLTVAPMIDFAMGPRTDLYITGGVGLYTFSLLLDSGFFQNETSDNYLGVNGGVGILRRVSTNWYLDFNVQINKFWTGDDLRDLFFVSAKRDQDPVFYHVTTGFLLQLF